MVAHVSDSQDNTEFDTTGEKQPSTQPEASTPTSLGDAVPEVDAAPVADTPVDVPVETSRASSDAVPTEDPELKKKTRRALLKYGALRLVLFVVLTVIIQVIAMLVKAPVPLVMSALLALIIAFPLSMLIFTNLREEATAGVAQLAQQRKEHKEWIKNELARR